MLRRASRSLSMSRCVSVLIGTWTAACGCADPKVSASRDFRYTRTANGHEVPVPCPGEFDITNVLETWSAGERERALSDFLLMAGKSPAASCLRPYHHSEASFVALPRDEQDALRAEMVEVYREMLDLARDLRKRAIHAGSAGLHDQAAEIVHAMELLAEANRGADVMLLADICGKAVARMADEARSAIDTPTQDSKDVRRPLEK